MYIETDDLISSENNETTTTKPSQLTTQPKPSPISSDAEYLDMAAVLSQSVDPRLAVPFVFLLDTIITVLMTCMVATVLTTLILYILLLHYRSQL